MISYADLIITDNNIIIGEGIDAVFVDDVGAVDP